MVCWGFSGMPTCNPCCCQQLLTCDHAPHGNVEDNLCVAIGNSAGLILLTGPVDGYARQVDQLEALQLLGLWDLSLLWLVAVARQMTQQGLHNADQACGKLNAVAAEGLHYHPPVCWAKLPYRSCFWQGSVACKPLELYTTQLRMKLPAKCASTVFWKHLKQSLASE